MPSELDGRPVEETHETYDPDGNLVSVVKVTRSPRVTDVDRDEMYALHERDAAMCSCGCGQRGADTRDSEDGWTVDVYKCSARAALDMAQRDAHQAALPEGQRDSTWSQGRPKPTDGQIFVVVGKAPPPDQPTP